MCSCSTMSAKSSGVWLGYLAYAPKNKFVLWELKTGRHNDRILFASAAWSTGNHPGILPHTFPACAAAHDVSDFWDLFCFPCRAQTSKRSFCSCATDFMQDFQDCFATEGVQDEASVYPAGLLFLLHGCLQLYDGRKDLRSCLQLCLEVYHLLSLPKSVLLIQASFKVAYSLFPYLNTQFISGIWSIP